MYDDDSSSGSGAIPGLPPRPHRGWTFDEQPVGKRWSTSRRTITETDLVVYATQFGFAEGLFLMRQPLSAPATTGGSCRAAW